MAKPQTTRKTLKQPASRANLETLMRDAKERAPMTPEEIEAQRQSWKEQDHD